MCYDNVALHSNREYTKYLYLVLYQIKMSYMENWHKTSVSW